jgi:hypothetical protein
MLPLPDETVLVSGGGGGSDTTGVSGVKPTPPVALFVCAKAGWLEAITNDKSDVIKMTALPVNRRAFSFERFSLTPALSRKERENSCPMAWNGERKQPFRCSMCDVPRRDFILSAVRGRKRHRVLYPPLFSANFFISSKLNWLNFSTPRAYEGSRLRKAFIS